jgi:hypothetical protein
MSRFVVVRDDSESAKFGIGKLISRVGGTAQIAFFYSPTTESAVVEVRTAAAELAAVPEQTRAYWQDPRSGAGCVVADAEERILIRFPNKRRSALIGRRRIH